jgi:hypothetical protein
VEQKAGVRLEEEEHRVPGQGVRRLLLTFDPGKLPSKEETAYLRAEGMRYEGDIKAWTLTANAENRLLAHHAYNGLLEKRGFGPQIAVPGR